MHEYGQSLEGLLQEIQDVRARNMSPYHCVSLRAGSGDELADADMLVHDCSVVGAGACLAIDADAVAAVQFALSRGRRQWAIRRC